MKMQAALWYGPEEIRLEEIGVPDVGPGEVLVKIGAALTCGTDFKLFRRGHPVLVKSVPSLFGHEMAGTIVEKDREVTGFEIGDKVVAANSAPCGECFFCVREQWNLCENLEFLNGAYAEYIKIPARIVQKNLYKIPAGVDFHEAAATEPLACALHCFEKVQLKPEEMLCVIGAGPCALLFVQLGKMKGANVICLSRGEEKLAIAKRLGANHTVSILEEDFRRKVELLSTEGRGPDVVIEVVGQLETWKLAASLVRKGGRVWLYGGCAKDTHVSFDTQRIHYEEISLHGVFHHTPRHFSESLSLIAERKIDLTPLIGERRKLSEISQVFRKGVAENPLKIAIVP